MVTKITSKKLLIASLLFSIIISAFFIYKNTQPSILLSKDLTYYLPGQQNNCLWIIKLDNNIRNYPGSNSEIKIGIPQAQKMGYLAGRIEVGRDNTLILAFNPPMAKPDKPPVVMTADYSTQALPIKSIRFRWTQSSLVTILLFEDKKVCLASRIRK
tara:strand:- start:1214 stop:1684 length:471 start_codon:yes stop_codon:yes gene_type:complete